MEIQKNISATMKRKLREYRNQTEFAQELGIGHTTLQNLLAERCNPSADTIELLAKGLEMTPAQLISGETVPADRAFDLISGMVEALHPATQRTAKILLEDLCQVFLDSEELYEQGSYWQYAVISPRPFRYALQAAEWTDRGWVITPAESKDFTDDRQIAEAAAELFTRSSLSPIHLEEAIEDYMTSL